MAAPSSGGDARKEARVALRAWQERLCVARATAQARQGDLNAAEATLARIDRLATSPPSLDLLARIRAQQGRLAEARSLWDTAAELEPDNTVYRLSARRAEAWQRIPVRPDRVRLVVVAAAAAMFVFLIWAVAL